MLQNQSKSYSKNRISRNRNIHFFNPLYRIPSYTPFPLARAHTHTHLSPGRGRSFACPTWGREAPNVGTFSKRCACLTAWKWDHWFLRMTDTCEVPIKYSDMRSLLINLPYLMLTRAGLSQNKGSVHTFKMASSISIPSCAYAWPIGSMFGIYANIWGILMVNVTIYI